MKKIVNLNKVINIITNIFQKELHIKRQKSLANAVYGAMHASRLSSSSIGQSFAAVEEKSPKHAVKQVDRLLGNDKYEMEKIFPLLIPWIIGQRKKITVTIDWTEFCYTGQYLLALHMVSKHGRATLLMWRTIDDRKLKNNRTRYEKELLQQFHFIVPKELRVTILGDRGFSNTDFFSFIRDKLGWEYIIRIKNNIYIESDNIIGKARDWVPRNGRILELKDAIITKSKKALVPSVVLTKKRGMKDAWHLATSIKGRKEHVVNLYERRFTCEEQFRDMKDDRFGVGLKETIVTTLARRDMLLLVNAISTILLTVLGAVGEYIGYSRYLKANTVKRRTHSLYRQGRQYVKGVTDVYYSLFKTHFTQLIENIRHTSLTYDII